MNQEEGGKGGGGGRELPNEQLTSGSRIFRGEPSEHLGSQREDCWCVCPDSRSAAGKCKEKRRKKNKERAPTKTTAKGESKGGRGVCTCGHTEKEDTATRGGWSRWPKGRNGGGWWGVWMLWLPAASGQHCEPVLQLQLCAAEVAPCGHREQAGIKGINSDFSFSFCLNAYIVGI